MPDFTDPWMGARATELLNAQVPSPIIEKIALRTGSSRALDLLDLLAERTGIAQWLSTAGYARGTRATSRGEALRAVAQLSMATAAGSTPPRHQELLIELLVLLGEDSQAARLLEEGKLPGINRFRRLTFEADLVNPFRDVNRGESDWLSTVNQLFPDLAPVRLRDPISDPHGETDEFEPFDRLATNVEAGTLRGDLVSVVVSSYRPGPGLETAVRSILQQTWADLEVLVVDDASGPEFSDVYARVEALDERVRVLRHLKNGGTYVARNTAIDQAKGTFVTFQDADDWSHPERIARQVEALERDTMVHAVHTRSLRTSGSLLFSRQGTAVLTPAAATLMFRREQVWATLGGYDVVRKAADTEFHERISVALPGHSVEIREPLMWVRLGDGSLSRAEFRAGWRHPARLIYRSAFGRWHDEIKCGSSPHIDRSVRAFPAPQRFWINPPSVAKKFDLVVFADWRGADAVARDAVEWVGLLAGDGVRIALVHVERLNFDGLRPPTLANDVESLASLPNVSLVPWDETIEAKALVAIEPEVMEFLPDTAPGTRAARIIVLLDATPRLIGTLDGVEKIVKDRWGADTTWSPRSASIATELAAAGMRVSAPFPQVVPPFARQALRRPSPMAMLAPIGIAPSTFDDTVEAASALSDAGIDVRVRVPAGMAKALSSRMAADATKVLWLPTSSQTLNSDLAAVTDLVVLGPSSATEAGQLAASAAARGVRTHYWQSTTRGDRLAELIRRVRDEATGSAPDGGDRDWAEESVRAWYSNVLKAT